MAYKTLRPAILYRWHKSMDVQQQPQNSRMRTCINPNLGKGQGFEGHKSWTEKHSSATVWK